MIKNITIMKTLSLTVGLGILCTAHAMEGNRVLTENRASFDKLSRSIETQEFPNATPLVPIAAIAYKYFPAKQDLSKADGVVREFVQTVIGLESLTSHLAHSYLVSLSENWLLTMRKSAYNYIGACSMETKIDCWKAVLSFQSEIASQHLEGLVIGSFTNPSLPAQTVLEQMKAFQSAVSNVTFTPWGTFVIDRTKDESLDFSLREQYAAFYGVMFPGDEVAGRVSARMLSEVQAARKQNEELFASFAG